MILREGKGHLPQGGKKGREENWVKGTLKGPGEGS